MKKTRKKANKRTKKMTKKKKEKKTKSQKERYGTGNHWATHVMKQ